MNRFKLPSALHSFELRLFLAIWFIYALHVVPGGGVNPNRYFDLTHSLVNEHTITIDAYHENTIDKAFKDGHYYSVGLPGPSVAGIPAYLVFKVVYRFLPASWLKRLSSVQPLKQGSEAGFYQRDSTSFFLSTIWITLFSLSLISALAAVVLFKIFLRLGVSRGNALLATVAYAFGTPVFFYSTTFFSHAFSASVAIFTLYLLLGITSPERQRSFILLGFLAGLAALMEYESLVFIGGVGLYVLYRWRGRPFLSYCSGVAIALSVLLAYNAFAFGGPFHAAYQFAVGENERYHSAGLLGFTFPRFERLFGLTLSPERGLFVYSPVLLLAFVGWTRTLRQRKQPIYGLALLSILVITSLWLWMASFTAWNGSATFGPRLLISALPFMFIGVAVSLSYVPKTIALPLVILSVATNWLGAQYGFAANIWEPWRRFLTSGFVLPAVSAILSHSRSESGLTAFITHWNWLITVIYGVLVVACIALVVSSMWRDRAKHGSMEIISAETCAGRE